LEGDSGRTTQVCHAFIFWRHANVREPLSDIIIFLLLA
jgi:hypothetical protein